MCCLCFHPSVFLSVHSCFLQYFFLPLRCCIPRSPLSCCIYCVSFLSLPAVLAPHCRQHFIPPQLIFYTYQVIWAGLWLICLCHRVCVCVSDNGHVVSFSCVVCLLLVGYLSVGVPNVPCYWCIFNNMCTYMCVCVCVWAYLSGFLVFLSLFVTSTVQFSEWENLDCILSGLYGLLHFFWSVCVCVCACWCAFVLLLCSCVCTVWALLQACASHQHHL